MSHRPRILVDGQEYQCTCSRCTRNRAIDARDDALADRALGAWQVKAARRYLKVPDVDYQPPVDRYEYFRVVATPFGSVLVPREVMP
jgi:hypothetical protein